MEHLENKSEKVELILPGIDKVWVRSKGKWVDKNELYQETVEVTIHEVDEDEMGEHSKKWWQFWKKR